ncbi:hypothetical protein 4L372X_030 [Aeromonas phage 4_L372X]|nr:hypothetical protein 4L372X_030 [Aeromonas phage 4_L372X]
MIKRYIKKLLGIDVLESERDKLISEIASIKSVVAANERDIADAVSFIKKATTVSGDISPMARDPSMVIVVGRYRSNDYVKVFEVGGEFSRIVDQLRDMERHCGRGRYDKPIGMNIDAFIGRL